MHPHVVTPQEHSWLIRDKYHGDVAAPGVQEDVQRLEAGEPLAYVIGWVPFLGCQIDVSLKPLIPRPETEFWTSEVIKEMHGNEKVLDLCCGSGCIGVAIAKHLPNVKIDFADVSPRAVQQTSINVQKNAIDGSRTAVYESDLFSALSETQYDLIVCNPPYVDRFGEYSTDVKWEPDEAIFAQKSGLGLIEEIIFESKKWLVQDGKLVLEFGLRQEEEVEKFLRKAEWRNWKLKKDQFDVVRWVEVRR